MSMTKQEFTKIAKPKIIQFFEDWRKSEKGQWVFYSWSIQGKGGQKILTKIVNIIHDDFETIANKLIDGMVDMAAFYHGDLDTIQLPSYKKKLNKQTRNMKKLTWQQWTALGIFAAAVIALVVLHFVQPTVSYAFTEAMTAGGVVVGGIGGYMLKAKNIIKSESAEK